MNEDFDIAIESRTLCRRRRISMRGKTLILVIDGGPYANMTLREIPADDIESINFLN